MKRAHGRAAALEDEIVGTEEGELQLRGLDREQVPDRLGPGPVTVDRCRFELYVELLGEAVAELAGERRIAPRPVRVDARIDAYVPAEYIPAEAQKIDLHRRLVLTETEDELAELEAGTIDRYGPLPEPVGNLFAIQAAKLKLALLGADYLVFKGGRSTVGPLHLGSEDLRALRARVDTAIYASARNEVSVKHEAFPEALQLVDAILETRQAA